MSGHKEAAWQLLDKAAEVNAQDRICGGAYGACMRTERGLQGETQRTAGGGVGVAVMRAHTHMHGLCVMNPTATVYEISLYTAPRSGCMFLRCLRMHARMRACVGVLTA